MHDKVYEINVQCRVKHPRFFHSRVVQPVLHVKMFWSCFFLFCFDVSRFFSLDDISNVCTPTCSLQGNIKSDMACMYYVNVHFLHLYIYIFVVIYMYIIYIYIFEAETNR